DVIGSTGGLGIVTPERVSGYAVLGGGLHADLGNNASAFVQYEAQLIDTDTTTYGIYGGFRWHFDDHLLEHPSLAFSDSLLPYRDKLQSTPLGEAMDFINLQALVMLQYDHAETASTGGATPDPDDPADTDLWFARRIRLSADRDLGWGFNLGGSFQFTEEVKSSDSAVELFDANLGWDLFEPFSLYAGLDKVPLGWEETTGSARLKTIERSVATRALGRLGGDQIGRSH
ncbi:MAG TPA: porin, partial [Bacteroidia bacterium]|nr:porin [Bacteroidia bacterium]